jgi:hypothetical protein
MKRFFAALALAAACTLPAAAPASSGTAMTAMPTCAAGDPVVWVNTKTKVYHMKGDSYFGNTKSGKYACKSAADAMGAHAAGSGSSMTGTSKKSKGKSTMMASPAPAAT